MVATLENAVADKVLATIGAVLWSVQVIPQIIKSYRTKSTEGLSAILMFIWACATIFQGSYLVSMRSSIPLQVQPQAFGTFGVISWAQCLYYGLKVPLRRVILYVCIFFAIFVGFEVGSVYALWAGERRGVEWPKQMYGWITSALLILGLMPQYYEIYKHRRVVGISILFMLVDIFGGIFSGVSLFFRREFDSTAFVQYMLVVVLDGVVVILKPILDYTYKRSLRERGMSDEEADVGTLPAADADADADDRTQNGEDVVTSHESVFEHKTKEAEKPDSGRSVTVDSEGTAVSESTAK